jgi:hypothetical protein
MVMRRPGEIGAEVARPVSWRDAKRFSWVTIVVAALIVGAAVAGMYPWMNVEKTFRANLGLEYGPPGRWTYPLVALWTGPGLIAVVVLGTLAGMGAATWWVRVWFWMLARTRRDRASAIACYGSAWWLAVGLIAAANIGAWNLQIQTEFFFNWSDFPWLTVVLQVLLGFVVLAQMLRILQRAARRGWIAITVAAVGIPAGEVVLFAACLALVDYLLGLLALMWVSLWG